MSLISSSVSPSFDLPVLEEHRCDKADNVYICVLSFQAKLWFSYAVKGSGWDLILSLCFFLGLVSLTKPCGVRLGIPCCPQ